MIKNYYDIIIIGAGVSGLILANEIIERTNKKVLILEKQKNLNSGKNLCFWNKPKNILTKHVDNKWKNICVLINDKKIKLQSKGIEYLRIKSENLSNFFLKKLKQKENFSLLMNQKIISLRNKKDLIKINSNKAIYNTSLVFDSRIDYKSNCEKNLYQHFYGIELTLNKNLTVYDEVILMDIQNKKNVFNFFYILPISKKKVFVETTYFSSKILTKEDYNKDLKNYLKKKFCGYKYKIKSHESGVIPMFKYRENNSSNHIKIGTAGNWVKQSTGYSLQNCFKYSKEIVLLKKSLSLYVINS